MISEGLPATALRPFSKASVPDRAAQEGAVVICSGVAVNIVHRLTAENPRSAAEVGPESKQCKHGGLILSRLLQQPTTQLHTSSTSTTTASSQNNGASTLLLQLLQLTKATRLPSWEQNQPNGQQPHPDQLRNPSFPIALRPIPDAQYPCLLSLLHPGHLAIYSLLDVHLLCGHSFLRCGLCRDHAMPELENWLGNTGHIRGDWRVAGTYGREYRWFGVSFCPGLDCLGIRLGD